MVKFKIFLLIMAIFSLVFLVSWIFFVSPYIFKFSESDLRDWINTGVQKVYDTDTKTYSENFQSIILRDSITSLTNKKFEISSSSIGGDKYSGEIYWNASIIYFVDRYSRKNIYKENDTEKESYFTFPPNTKKIDYLFNSPEVLEKEGLVKFNGETYYQSYRVYNFSYSLENLDKTQFFPLVPRDNKIIGNHHGSMLVEPNSGVILYFEHSGINKLYDSSGKYILDYEIWSNSFNDFTLNKQLVIADNLQNRNLLNSFGIGTFSIMLALSLILYLYLLIKDNLLD
jgi:hypothetical protein